MRATELRIGNLVIDKGKIKPMYSISNHNAKDYSRIEPIPLTEEWLLRFGFTSEGEGNEAWLDLKNEIENNKVQLRTWVNFECFQEYNGTAFFMLENYEGVDYTTIIPRKFKYVHQLQNLYFALTGEELTL